MKISRNILFMLAITIPFLLPFSKKHRLLIAADLSAGVQEQGSEIIYTFTNTVKIGDYFEVMENIVQHYNTILSYPITEHQIIRNNPWVMDSLAASDYYLLKERGITSLDPKEIPIFKPGQFLIIPDSLAADSLNRVFKQTYLDLNIPEFKLRVMQADKLIHEFPVRVGRNESRYLAMAGRVLNLQTLTGEGTIVRHAKNPSFINPVNNRRYHVTRRDDGVVTGLPNIPWLETEINGIRHGQLIHPTTNIETLGKAYSNGCIGTSEAAGWYLYYYAPLGTRITLRYDLDIVDEEGNPVKLPNVYNL